MNPLQAIEETEHVDGNFTVFQICPHCKFKFNKLTRSHFSYNTIDGACQQCKGIGRVVQMNMNTLFNMESSIEKDAITLWKGRYLEYQVDNLKRTMSYYDVPP